MYPESTIYVKSCCPDSCTTEKVVAEHLTDVARVILEPFEVELSDAFDFVILVLVELAEVDSEMTVLPVCAIYLVVSAGFRPAA